MGLYLDYNASAPMIKISIAAMIESMNVIGNPSSIHTSGRNAKAIIEVGLESLNPDPSFGSHFFQNVTSLHIAYFTIIVVHGIRSSEEAVMGLRGDDYLRSVGRSLFDLGYDVLAPSVTSDPIAAGSITLCTLP